MVGPNRDAISGCGAVNIDGQAEAAKPTCERCTAQDKAYQLRLQEAKARAPMDRLNQVESQLQQANKRWRDLGQQMEAAAEDICRYRTLNHQLIFACDKNQELRAKNAKLASRLKNQKGQHKSVVGRMRAELEDLHLKTGKSTFSAGFQSALATEDKRTITKFMDPEMEVSPSKSIS